MFQSSEAHSQPRQALTERYQSNKSAVSTLAVLFVLTTPSSLFALWSVYFAIFAVGWVLALPGLLVAGIKYKRGCDEPEGRLTFVSRMLLLWTLMLQILFAGIWLGLALIDL